MYWLADLELEVKSKERLLEKLTEPASKYLIVFSYSE
jgi:hypothetical protein